MQNKFNSHMKEPQEELNSFINNVKENEEEFSEMPFEESFGLILDQEEVKEITELPDRMVECLETVINGLCEHGADRNRIELTQKPVCIQILLAYLNKKHFILEAPTGVGKSIIAFIVTHTIHLYNRKHYQDSYILTSSKSLQEQLDKDCKRFELNRYQLLKGQSNYFCEKNGKPFPQRECERMSMNKAFDELKCGPTCKYLLDRRKAISSECAIFSYAYFLTTMNFVFNSIGSNAPFGPRTITVFDECHTLADSLQNMFTIVFTSKFRIQIDEVQSSLLNIITNSTMSTADRCAEVVEQIKLHSDELFEDENISTENLFTILEVLYINLKDYTMLLKACLPKDYEESEDLYVKKIAVQIERIDTLWQQMQYFIENNKDKLEWVVCKREEIGLIKKLTLQTLLDDVLFKRHVEPFIEFGLFMSATIGDIPQFAKQNGIENYRYAYMPSDFNFDKSPIYFVKPNISLAMKNKNTSMPILFERMLYICEQLHPDERGIIHTGNFEITKKFKEYVRMNSNAYRRYMFYENSEQKEIIIHNLSTTTNGILIGPSLIEGIDLKDDLARFCIMAKVQYPALDIFNKKRLELIPGWYDWKTFTSFLQSIGRVIRHKNDYAITYLMDSCFKFLFKKMPPQGYIEKRFKDFDINDKMFKEDETELFDY